MKFKACPSVLLTAVFLAAFAMPSQAATIVGTKCTKVGTAKTVSKVKYVCAKSGTKLIWKKGTAITATAKPQPSVSATPKPSVSATPTSQSATVKPSTSATPAPSQSATQIISPTKSAAPIISPTKSAAPSANSGLTKLTLEEVSKRDSSASCWSIIYGNVFNLTKWISKHPGGAEKIRAICGKDGTTSFERQHTGDGGAANQLSSYFLGKLGDSVKL
jgi:cytochrome b involved in lipid metabolism